MFSIIGLCVAVSLLCGLSEQACSDFNFTPVPLVPVNLAGSWNLVATRDDGLPYHSYSCIRFFSVVSIPGQELRTTERAKNPATNAYETSTSYMVFSSAGKGEYTYVNGDYKAKTTIIKTDYLTYYVEANCDDTNGVYVGIFIKPLVDPLTVNLILKIELFEKPL